MSDKEAEEVSIHILMITEVSLRIALLGLRKMMHVSVAMTSSCHGGTYVYEVRKLGRITNEKHRSIYDFA